MKPQRLNNTDLKGVYLIATGKFLMPKGAFITKKEMNKIKNQPNKK